MALTLAEKKAVVADVAEVAKKAGAAAVADYRGLTVSSMTKLRSDARSKGIYMRIVPNNLARRALSDTEFACLNDSFIGPSLLAFSFDEPGAVARLMRDSMKDYEQLAVKVLALDGQVYPADALDRLATLPTRDEAIAQLMSVMKAPTVKFVRTLSEPHAKLVRTFAAVRDKKQQASG